MFTSTLFQPKMTKIPNAPTNAQCQATLCSWVSFSLTIFIHPISQEHTKLIYFAKKSKLRISFSGLAGQQSQWKTAYKHSPWKNIYMRAKFLSIKSVVTEIYTFTRIYIYTNKPTTIFIKYVIYNNYNNLYNVIYNNLYTKRKYHQTSQILYQ